MNKCLYFKKSPVSLVVASLWLLAMLIWLINIYLSGFDPLELVNAVIAFICSVIWFYIHYWLRRNHYLKIAEKYLVINSSLLKRNKKFFYHNITGLEKQGNIIVLKLKTNKKIKIFLKALNEKDQIFMKTEFMDLAAMVIPAKMAGITS